MKSTSINVTATSTEISTSPALLNQAIALSGNVLSLAIGLYSMALHSIHNHKDHINKVARYSAITIFFSIAAVVFMQLFLRAIDIEYEGNLAAVEKYNSQTEQVFLKSQNLN